MVEIAINPMVAETAIIPMVVEIAIIPVVMETTIIPVVIEITIILMTVEIDIIPIVVEIAIIPLVVESIKEAWIFSCFLFVCIFSYTQDLKIKSCSRTLFDTVLVLHRSHHSDCEEHLLAVPGKYADKNGEDRRLLSTAQFSGECLRILSNSGACLCFFCFCFSRF